MLVHAGVDLTLQGAQRVIRSNSRRRQVYEPPEPDSASEEQEGKCLIFQGEEKRQTREHQGGYLCRLSSVSLQKQGYSHLFIF